MDNCRQPHWWNLLRRPSRIAYKVMVWENGQWVTPFREMPVSDGQLIAEGEPQWEENWLGDHILEGGAIHCYRRHQDAHSRASYSATCIAKAFKVQGTDLVAWDGWHDEVAFRKVTFLDPLDPPAEVAKHYDELPGA